VGPFYETPCISRDWSCRAALRLTVLAVVYRRTPSAACDHIVHCRSIFSSLIGTAVLFRGLVVWSYWRSLSCIKRNINGACDNGENRFCARCFVLGTDKTS